jgi:hypothetical protein
LARIVRVLLQAPVMEDRSQVVGFSFGKRFGPARRLAQRSSISARGLGTPTLGLDGIARLQTPLLLPLADKRAQVLRHTFPEPVDTTIRMFPGTCHCEGHCTRRVASSH